MLNDPPPPQETWDAGACLGPGGVINCTAPRPIVRAWYQADDCESAWTLNDPAITLPRFTAITTAGGWRARRGDAAAEQ